ncbi:GNAT family N-acetyltransferase [Bergeriella denitrificans]|uniref:Acetyltransferase (GNAT) family n=1 Tax=Bergeriella denitrificans TaxID=494 RepID=A0A378UH00_BERDE|nr:GNAT family N-acetyltransferase [Bergeriella denitrificans]STZ76410.1 Acetyltransferase (GNAT) family [Bergeriella denitrificans]
MPTLRHQPEISAFILTDHNKEAGRLDYRLADNVMNIVHTEVNPAYQGQGLARKLVEAALAEADAQGLDIRADCDYARSVLARAGRLKS